MDDGRETLILQVKYEGAAGDFGWVVPVPGRPEIDTAPGDLFLELAWVTRPILVPSGWNKAQMGGVASAGVEVVERVQVGPYDATVLAATDPEALAGWLEERGYRMPEGAADVLKSYTDRGWCYAALRIATERLQEELLAELREVAPGIESLDDAPDEVAAVIVKAADEGDPTGEAKVRALGGSLYRTAWAASQGEMWRPGGREKAREGWESRVLRHYARVLEKGDPLARGLVNARELKPCVEGCPAFEEEPRVLRLARAAGFDQTSGMDELVEEVVAEANRDVREGVPYRESAWRRWHEVFSAARKEETVDPAYEQEYEVLIAELASYHRMPLREPPAGREVYAQAYREPLTASAVRCVLDAVAARSRLYHAVRAEVSQAMTAVQRALESGTIEPLRLEFDTRELVYPLYITSLGEGATDVQLYVLSNHRMMARAGRGDYWRRFDARFAGRLDAEALERAPTLAGLAQDGRGFLTELRAKLTAEEMTDDVVFARAPTNAPYREEVTAEELARRGATGVSGLPGRGRASVGGALGGMIGTKERVLLGILVVGVVIAAVNRVRRRASR